MPLTPITLKSTHEPFRLRMASTSQSCVQVVAPATVTFLDDSAAVTYFPTSAPSAVARSIYDGTTTTIDATSDNWLLLAVKGTAYPVWIKERDFGTIETLTNHGAWAPLRMLAGGKLHPLFLEQTGIPTGVKGDLLYHDGTAWVLRHIAEGNQGDVLMDDKDVSGVPIWQSIAQALGPTNSGTTTGSSVIAGGVCLDAGVGGALPSGWQADPFNDSAWGAAVTQAGGVMATPPPGGQWVTYASGDVAGSEVWGLRQHFAVAAGTITSAILTIIADNIIDALYINGNLVTISPSDWGITSLLPAATVDISAQLHPGSSTNLIAVQVRNGPTGFQPTALAFALTVNGHSVPPPLPATALPDATTTTVGAVLIDQAPPSGHPRALTTTRLGAANGVAELDASSHVPLTELFGITHSQLDAAAGIVHGQIASVDAADLVGSGTLPVGVLPSSVPITLGTPTNGTMMVFNLGFWLMLAPGPDGTKLTMVGGMPTWS